MKDELIELTVEEPTEQLADIELEEEEVGIGLEDLEQNVETEEEIDVVDVEMVEAIEIEVDEAIGWTGGDSTRHYSLSGRDENNQHPITAISGLRVELDEIERYKTVYSDKINIANYYEWNDGGHDDYGYFVSLVEGTKIGICKGSNIFGVTVPNAGFVGGQNQEDPRGYKYGLVATSGLVSVRCELDVEKDNYVISNGIGVAEKASTKCGYRVINTGYINGVRYAMISLGVQACTTDALGRDIQGLDKRMGDAELNIASAINVANEAYNKASECVASNQEMSGKVDNALGVVDGIVSDVEDMESRLEDMLITSAQAKVIAESAVTSAESIRAEAVESANQALAETSELKKEFELEVDKINTDLNNTELELQSTKENIEATRNALQTSINNVSSELDNTKTDLNNTRDELSSEIDDIVNSLSDTDKTVALITKRVDENETSINSLTTWKDTASVAITNIEQKTDENSGNISILTAWKTDVEDDVESIASIKTQSDANKSSIESLTSWQGTASESLASVKQQSDANKASIDSITSWQGETEESIANVKQQADDNAASIQSLTEWKGTTSQSISSIEQRVDDTESSITSLTSWQDDAKTSIANVEQKASNNESKINSLTSWQGEASESIANVEQKATANESAITSLTTWKGEATESIAAVKQTANQNSADISIIATWKSDVEDDVSSIASIKTTADENTSAISELVKKDTELSTTIAGVKTTADANKASIEEITSWQSKVDPTINSVAGIKQTADGNAAKIEGLTAWQGNTNIAMARIEQKADANGAYIQHTVVDIDKYSVGPFSQAYGFTLDQARDALEEGMVYVPIETSTDGESYKITNLENSAEWTYKFTKGYYYVWTYVVHANETNKFEFCDTWSTTNKSTSKIYYAKDTDLYWYYKNNAWKSSFKASDAGCLSGLMWKEMQTPPVWHAANPPAGTPYLLWYTNAKEGIAEGYEPQTLYKFESYTGENEEALTRWIAVATLSGNASNRSMSQIRQTANSIELSVTDLRGAYAGLKKEVDSTSAKVNSVAAWPTGNGNHYLATIEQKASGTGSSLVLAAVTENGVQYLDGATIVLNNSSSGSYIQFDADCINFTAEDYQVIADNIDFSGYVTFTDLSTQGSTQINGANITTGKIDAARLNVSDIITVGDIATNNDIPENISDLKNDVGFITDSSVPKNISELVNDSGYTTITRDDVTTITKDTVTTTYVDALGITAAAIQIKNANNYVLLQAAGTTVDIGDFTVGNNGTDSYIASNGKTGYSEDSSGVYLGTDGIGCGEGEFYVTSSGALYANNAEITGIINAHSGYIGGFEITSSGIVGGSHSFETEGNYYGAITLNSWDEGGMAYSHYITPDSWSISGGSYEGNCEVSLNFDGSMWRFDGTALAIDNELTVTNDLISDGTMILNSALKTQSPSSSTLYGGLTGSIPVALPSGGQVYLYFNKGIIVQVGPTGADQDIFPDMSTGWNYDITT